MGSEKTNIQSEWQKFHHLFNREKVAAKTTLLKEGELAKKVYYQVLCFTKRFCNTIGIATR
jgi:hypothetical protein